MAQQQRLKPGMTSPISAQMKVVGPRGGISGREITVVKGKTLPPGPAPGVTYKVTDPTNNKSGRKR